MPCCPPLDVPLPLLPMQYDITAVGSTMCRHSIVAHLMDISTGERYIYACVMLYALMMTHAMPVLFVWYDINCRFSGYFLKWASAILALSELLQRVATKFALPVFHRYAHRWVWAEYRAVWVRAGYWSHVLRSRP